MRKLAFSAFWRSNVGEGEDDNRGELRIQRGRNRRGKERKECRSCSCEEDQGGYGKRKQLGKVVSRATDLKG